MGSVDDSSAEVNVRPPLRIDLSNPQWWAEPGDLNIPIYLAPSPEASTLLVTAYRYNGLPIPIGKQRSRR